MHVKVCFEIVKPSDNKNVGNDWHKFILMFSSFYFLFHIWNNIELLLNLFIYLFIWFVSLKCDIHAILVVKSGFQKHKCI